MTTTLPAVRINPHNPNHHLWLNNGTWFLHYATHTGPFKGRVRRSLGTKSLKIARERRDSALSHLLLQSRFGLPVTPPFFSAERKAA